MPATYNDRPLTNGEFVVVMNGVTYFGVLQRWTHSQRDGFFSPVVELSGVIRDSSGGLDTARHNMSLSVNPVEGAAPPAANRNGDVFAQPVSHALEGGSVLTSTPRSRANTFEAEWAAASQDGSHAFRSARSPAADIIVAQSIAQAHQTIRERADQQFMAHMAEALAVEATPVTEQVALAQRRIGALGRAWLVSHFISTFVPLTTETTSLDVIEMCTENVRQALEAAANLYPQMSERWLHVTGYPRREDFPPVETAAATCHDTIYFARNTRTLYWVRPADGFWRAAPAYVPFAPLSSPRLDAQPPTVDGSASAPFTLPAGTAIPTRAVQGDSVVVSMPQVRPARTWRIHHAGNFDNTDGVAGLAFDRQVDAVMALVSDSELPDNFRGVVTFGDRDSFPERETLPDNAACWFYFARAEGDLWRVTPFRAGWQYSFIAHASVVPFPAASVTRPGGLQQMVNSWGRVSDLWGTRPAHFDHMRQPAPSPSPPQPAALVALLQNQQPRRLLLD